MRLNVRVNGNHQVGQAGKLSVRWPCARRGGGAGFSRLATRIVNGGGNGHEAPAPTKGNGTGAPMFGVRLRDLRPGDAVRHRNSHHLYVVTDRTDGRVLAMRTMDLAPAVLSDPRDWELIAAPTV